MNPIKELNQLAKRYNVFTKTLVYQHIDNGTEYYHMPLFFSEAFSTPEIIPFSDESLKSDVEKYIETFEHVIRVIDLSGTEMTPEMAELLGLRHKESAMILKYLTDEQHELMSNPE